MKIVIVMDGGLITDVLSNVDKKTEVICVDYDVDWLENEEGVNLVEVDGNLAYVYSEIMVKHNPSFVDKVSNLLK